MQSAFSFGGYLISWMEMEFCTENLLFEFFLCHCCLLGVRPWVSVKHLETIVIVTDAIYSK